LILWLIFHQFNKLFIIQPFFGGFGEVDDGADLGGAAGQAFDELAAVALGEDALVEDDDHTAV